MKRIYSSCGFSARLFEKLSCFYKFSCFLLVLFGLALPQMASAAKYVYLDIEGYSWWAYSNMSYLHQWGSTGTNWPGEKVTRLSGDIYYKELKSGNTNLIFNRTEWANGCQKTYNRTENLTININNNNKIKIGTKKSDYWHDCWYDKGGNQWENARWNDETYNSSEGIHILTPNQVLLTATGTNIQGGSGTESDPFIIQPNKEFTLEASGVTFTPNDDNMTPHYAFNGGTAYAATNTQVETSVATAIKTKYIVSAKGFYSDEHSDNDKTASVWVETVESCVEEFTLNNISQSINACDASKQLSEFTATSGNIPLNAIYEWTPSDQVDNAAILQPNYIGTTTQDLTLKITNADKAGCFATATASITYDNNTPAAEINTRDNTKVAVNTSLTLDADASGATTIAWKAVDGSGTDVTATVLADPTIEDVVFNAPATAGTYTLTLTSTTDECIETASVNLVVKEPIVIRVQLPKVWEDAGVTELSNTEDDVHFINPRRATDGHLWYEMVIDANVSSYYIQWITANVSGYETSTVGDITSNNCITIQNKKSTSCTPYKGQTCPIFPTEAILQANAASNILATTATLNAKVTDKGIGETAITEYGFYWSATQGFDVADGTKVKVAETDIDLNVNYSALIEDLTASTTYYYIAYAVNVAGTAYSTESSFTTLAPCAYSVDFKDMSVDINNCSGEKTLPQVVLSDGGAIDSRLTNYVWTAIDGAPALDVAVPNTPTFDTSADFGTYTYLLTLNEPGSVSCVGTSTYTVNYIDNSPTATISTADNTNVEVNSTLVLGADLTGAETIAWIVKDALDNDVTATMLDDATIATPTFKATREIGSYTITVTSISGTCNIVSAPITLNVVAPVESCLPKKITIRVKPRSDASNGCWHDDSGMKFTITYTDINNDTKYLLNGQLKTTSADDYSYYTIATDDYNKSKDGIFKVQFTARYDYGGSTRSSDWLTVDQVGKMYSYEPARCSSSMTPTISDLSLSPGDETAPALATVQLTDDAIVTNYSDVEFKGGYIKYAGCSATPAAYGFEYGKAADLSDATQVEAGNPYTANLYFSGSATGLDYATTYYYRAYAVNSEGTGYSEIKSFETTAPVCSAPFELNNIEQSISACDASKQLSAVEVQGSGALPANATYAWVGSVDEPTDAQPNFIGTANEEISVRVSNSLEPACFADAVYTITYTDNSPIAVINTTPQEVKTNTDLILDAAGSLGNLLWSCPEGSFDDATKSDAVWTAPSAEGTYTLTLTASNGSCADDVTTVEITVKKVYTLTFHYASEDSWEWVYAWQDDGTNIMGDWWGSKGVESDFSGKDWFTKKNTVAMNSNEHTMNVILNIGRQNSEGKQTDALSIIDDLRKNNEWIATDMEIWVYANGNYNVPNSSMYVTHRRKLYTLTTNTDVVAAYQGGTNLIYTPESYADFADRFVRAQTNCGEYLSIQDTLDVNKDALEAAYAALEVGIARINTTYYSTLQDAIDAAAASDEVVLLQTVSENIEINKAVKLDGGGNAMGDMTIMNTGKLTLNGDIDFNNLVIKSSAVDGVGTGQLVIASGSQTAQSTRMDREIFAGAYRPNAWYTVGVPFAVDLSTGVYKTESNVPAINMSDFALNELHSQNRADYGVLSQRGPKYLWQFSTQMQRGIGYQVAVTNAASKTLSFYATDANEIFTSNNQVAYNTYTSSTQPSKEHNWNFLSQPLTQNAKLDFGAGAATIIQVQTGGGNNRDGSNGATYYDAIDLSSSAEQVMAPFAAIQYQSSAAGTVTFIPSENQATIRSVEAMPTADYFNVNFKNQEGFTDNLFVSGSDNADVANYEIGKDLLKAGFAPSLPQLYSPAFGLKLVANNALIENDEANIPMILNVPSAGNYSLSISAEARGTLYLLEYGSIIHNLSEDGVYQFSANAGSTDSYSLRIVYDENDDIVTDVENSDAETWIAYTTAQKLFIENILDGETFYIGNAVQTLYKGISNGNILEFEIPQPGMYWISAQGKTVKIVVH